VALTAAKNVYQTTGIAVTPAGVLYTASNFHSRILGFNTVPTTAGVAADFVVGQASFTANTGNRGGSVSNISLYGPTDLVAVGTKLIVADTGNNRVLIWNTAPIDNTTGADVVVGQASFTSNTTGTTQTTLSGPRGIASDGTKLVVVDSANARVLLWNTIPATNGAPADLVLGQTVFTSSAYNGLGGAGTADKFNEPVRAWTNGTKLLVLDGCNQRILIWNTWPTANGQLPDAVLGQTGFTTPAGVWGATNCSATQFRISLWYGGLWSDGNQIGLADIANNRVLIWNSWPTTNGAAADVVLGQPDFTTATAPSGATASTTGLPTNVRAVGGQLMVSCTGSSDNRILFFGSP